MEKKKLAVVTGASGGIGQSIAVRLAKDGFHVVAHYNSNAKGAEETFAKIRELGGTADIVQFDVRKSPVLEAALNPVVDNDQYVLAAVVNNAGMHDDALCGMMSDETFDRVVQTNLYGPFYLLRWATKRMMRLRSGCIVNISSISGQMGNPGQINYSAAKAGVIAMTQSLAQEIGSRNVRVNCVAPGFIETEMIKDLPAIDEFKKRIPLRRFGKSEEVAAAVSFLCSTEASYITGHTLSVNGGLLPT